MENQSNMMTLRKSRFHLTKQQGEAIGGGSWVRDTQPASI